VEAEKTAPEIAREAVDLIGRLFAMEKQAKDGSVAERSALRQTQSAPVLAELRQKLLTWKEQLLPKHPMAEAVNYTLSQWEELTVFTSDGAVPIDNNVNEREMKRVVLNRKNSLFVGKPSRRTDRSDPGQLDQQLPPARDGSATLLHATADESSLVAGK
jgi:transposase